MHPSRSNLIVLLNIQLDFLAGKRSHPGESRRQSAACSGVRDGEGFAQTDLIFILAVLGGSSEVSVKVCSVGRKRRDLLSSRLVQLVVALETSGMKLGVELRSH